MRKKGDVRGGQDWREHRNVMENERMRTNEEKKWGRHTEDRIKRMNSW